MPRSTGTGGELPAGDEEAIFKHHGLAYQPGGGGERQLAPRQGGLAERRIGCLLSFYCW